VGFQISCQESGVDSKTFRDSALARYNKASALHEQGRYKEALALLDELEQNWPGNAKLLYAKARTLRRLGRLEEALELCEYLVRKHDHERAEKLARRIKKKLLPHANALKEEPAAVAAGTPEHAVRKPGTPPAGTQEPGGHGALLGDHHDAGTAHRDIVLEQSALRDRRYINMLRIGFFGPLIIVGPLGWQHLSIWIERNMMLNFTGDTIIAVHGGLLLLFSAITIYSLHGFLAAHFRYKELSAMRSVSMARDAEEKSDEETPSVREASWRPDRFAGEIEGCIDWQSAPPRIAAEEETRVQMLGEEIHSLGGEAGMRLVFQILCDKKYYGVTGDLNRLWAGIGTWGR
jgi:tetratricopeptide (TPR) repeat protein